jgi:putative transposase
MENYRPPENRHVPELTFFVTTRLLSPYRFFEDSKYAQLVLDSLQFFRQRKEIELYAYVVMPTHIHAIIMPLGKHTISTIMRRFKNFVAHEVGQGPIWDEGFWSEVVPDVKFFRQKIGYVHENPVRAGLTVNAKVYFWSSAREYSSGEPFRFVDYAFGAPTRE